MSNTYFFIAVILHALLIYLATSYKLSNIQKLVNHQTDVIVMLAHAQLDIPYDSELLNEEGVE